MNAPADTNVDHPCWFLSFTVSPKSLLTSLQKVALSTMLYWSMIEGGLAVIAACLPTLQFLVRRVSLSSLVHSLRSPLSLGSVDTEGKKGYQRHPPNLKEPYTHIHAGSSTSSTSDSVEQKNKNPINILVRGNVDGYSEPQGHGIQVTRHFSQHASKV